MGDVSGKSCFRQRDGKMVADRTRGFAKRKTIYDKVSWDAQSKIELAMREARVEEEIKRLSRDPEYRELMRNAGKQKLQRSRTTKA